MSGPTEHDTRLTIWDFALAFYAQDGVEADCLTAQDHYGLDVTYLIAGGLEVAGTNILTAQWQAGRINTHQPNSCRHR